MLVYLFWYKSTQIWLENYLLVYLKLNSAIGPQLMRDKNVRQAFT